VLVDMGRQAGVCERRGQRFNTKRSAFHDYADLAKSHTTTNDRVKQWILVSGNNGVFPLRSVLFL